MVLVNFGIRANPLLPQVIFVTKLFILSQRDIEVLLSIGQTMEALELSEHTKEIIRMILRFLTIALYNTSCTKKTTVNSYIKAYQDRNQTAKQRRTTLVTESWISALRQGSNRLCFYLFQPPFLQKYYATVVNVCQSLADLRRFPVGSECIHVFVWCTLRNLYKGTNKGRITYYLTERIGKM